MLPVRLRMFLGRLECYQCDSRGSEEDINATSGIEMLTVRLSVKVKLPSGVSEVVLDVMSKSSQYISLCFV
jgi:hypothetical protein